jgi:glutathione S-transferase
VVSAEHRGLPVDQAVLTETLAELSAKLDVYEVILGKHKFLAGDVGVLKRKHWQF